MASASAGASGSGEPTAPVCAYPEHDDAIVLSWGEAIDLEEVVLHAVGLDRAVIGCGDGFVVASDVAFADATSRALEGTCVGIAAVDRDRAVLVTAAEISLVWVDGLGEPFILDRAPLANPAYGVATRDGIVVVGAGSEGLLMFDVDGQTLRAAEPVRGLDDARHAASVEDKWLVADGRYGVKLVDRSGVLSEIDLGDGTALKIVAQGSRALVLMGAMGFAEVEVVGSEVELVGEHRVEGRIFDATWSGEALVLALGFAIHRYQVGATGVRLLGQQERPFAEDTVPPWFIALPTVGGANFVTAGASLLPLGLPDAGTAPHVTTTHRTLSFWPDAKEGGSAAVVLANRGDAELIVGDLSVTPPFSATWSDSDALVARPNCPGQYTVAPGASVLAKVSLAAAGPETVVGALSMGSSDPDARTFRYRVEVNRPPPNPGNDAADYGLPTASGGRYRLSDHLGEVVLIKLFDDS